MFECASQSSAAQLKFNRHPLPPSAVYMKEKMSTTKLMFWNKNNNEKTNEAKTEAKNTKNGRNWLHAPDVLINGHVAYLVKVR